LKHNIHHEKVISQIHDIASPFDPTQELISSTNRWGGEEGQRVREGRTIKDLREPIPMQNVQVCLGPELGEREEL
jgi:hypothetical protein